MMRGVERAKQEADRIHEAGDHEASYKMLLKYKDCDDPDLLWRLARVTFKRCENAPKAEREAGLAEGITYLDKAVECGGDKLGPVHKWYSILIGSKKDHTSTKERIQDGFLIKKHVEKAIELMPQDPLNYYVLGNWLIKSLPRSPPWLLVALTNTRTFRHGSTLGMQSPNNPFVFILQLVLGLLLHTGPGLEPPGKIGATSSINVTVIHAQGSGPVKLRDTMLYRSSSTCADSGRITCVHRLRSAPPLNPAVNNHVTRDGSIGHGSTHRMQSPNNHSSSSYSSFSGMFHAGPGLEPLEKNRCNQWRQCHRYPCTGFRADQVMGYRAVSLVIYLRGLWLHNLCALPALSITTQPSW
ncbi:hypothetical protein HPB51_000856 [Rhipicephalus microplus]|uniref:Regulator of microtubule dynamics protein 1 n=1 Tax=Rhipicephalus microplus TaxID=6941 RepID=A0A9J6D7P9_RHIMP|nr:hypothetical protein HPB51_000856 [Rhipicephalus microplus]